MLLAGTEDQADRGVLARLTLVPVQLPQVQFHLPFVGRSEISQFQLDGNQSPEDAMVEKQIDVVIVAVHLNPFLAGDERKAHAQIENELLQLPQNGVFQVLFQIPVLDPEEFEKIGVAKHQIRREPIILAQSAQAAHAPRGTFRRRSPVAAVFRAAATR